jgi:hypothetical protein
LIALTRAKDPIDLIKHYLQVPILGPIEQFDHSLPIGLPVCLTICVNSAESIYDRLNDRPIQ